MVDVDDLVLLGESQDLVLELVCDLEEDRREVAHGLLGEGGEHDLALAAMQVA